MSDEYLYPEGYADAAVREWRGSNGGNLDQYVRRACVKTAVETLTWAAKSWGEGSDVNATLLDIADSLEMLAKEKEST